MVNSRAMAQRLAVRCQGQHEHQELISGRAKRAEEYPPALCKAMLEGLKQEWKEGRQAVFIGNVEDAEEDDGGGDIEDALERMYDREAQEGAGPARARPVPEDSEESDGEGRSGQVPRGVSRQDKALIRKLHVNLGHPSKEDFARALRMSRAREEVWRYVKDEFSCDVCKSKVLPKPARPSTIPKHYETCKTVGVDVVYMPSQDPNKNIPVLNVIDWASCYQTLEPLENTSSKTVWLAFQRSWCRTFGSPQIVVVDQGTEFQKDFAERASQAGSLIRTIGARAPWQQGRTERHGGIAKGVLEKVLDQVGPVDVEEWKMCVYAVEQAKNRLFNKSGFSPAQRQLGANIRMPGSLASEDPYDAALMRGTASQEMQRTLQIKETAMEAFIRHTTEESIRRAAKARSRPHQEFQKGEVVFVFRKPLPRKNVQVNREGRRATWVGPGVVILPEGANVWISMRGELWKCAREQVRSATPQEEEAYGLLRDEMEELQHEISRKASKRGFKDITKWDVPGEDEEDPMEGPDTQPPEQRRRIDQGGGSIQESSDSSSSSTSSSSSSAPSEDGHPHRGSETPGGPGDANHPEGGGFGHPSADNRGQCAEVKAQGETGLEPPATAPTSARASASATEGNVEQQSLGYGRMRRHDTSGRIKPYNSTMWTISTDDDIREVQATEDYWEFVEEEKMLIRHHVTPRRGPFRAELVDLSLVASKSSDEVHEKDISSEEWPEWQVADGEEWAKVASTNAVKALSVEESTDVEQQLKEAGRAQRIMPSRMVRRWKPAELPGEPPSRKSRWCVRGDKDPDLMMLERYAPTATTAVISIAIQTAASLGFRGAVGDLKNAFMQSDRLVRPEGRIFCRQPRGGLPGLNPAQLIEVLAGAYGLGDAPAHWRRSLRKVLLELGYMQSSMDPCLFKVFEGSKLAGLLIVEVDDILSFGNAFHYELMEKLQQRFKFGKFKYFDQEAEGIGFNGRRIRLKDGVYLVDMQKFVEESLNEVPLAVGRAKEKEAEATAEEKSLTRAGIGSLTWAAKEGRPDCAAAASIIASCLAKLKVQDILDLNKTIREVKKDASLCLRIQPISLQRLQWGVITDASYANTSGCGSQGAFGVICFDEDVTKKGHGKANLIYWRSGRIHRVVNSTLAAETQSLSRGLAELAWTITVFNDLITPNFDLRLWQEAAKSQRLHALAKDSTDERLKNSLCVVDAKSLYDHLAKDTIGVTEDKRTAIEMQVIRQSMCETGATVGEAKHKSRIIEGLIYAFASLSGRCAKIVILDYMMAPLAYARDMDAEEEPLSVIHVLGLTYPWGAVLSLAYALTWGGESPQKAWEQLTPELCGYIAMSCSFALALNFLGTFALHDLGASAQQIVGKLNTICLASISVAFLGEHLPVMVVLGSALSTSNPMACSEALPSLSAGSMKVERIRIVTVISKKASNPSSLEKAHQETKACLASKSTKSR
eukprot:s859_g17.t1